MAANEMPGGHTIAQSGDEMDGYTFDSGGFDGVRQAWADLRDDLADDLATARRLVGVEAPGHEPASGFVARDQNDSGQVLLDAIARMQGFVASYLAGLDQSGHQYQEQESSSGQALQSGVRR